MLPRRLHVTVLAGVLGAVLVADAVRAQQMFFYPQKGQNPQQQQNDQGRMLRVGLAADRIPLLTPADP
jgi:hypothetical protein